MNDYKILTKRIMVHLFSYIVLILLIGCHTESSSTPNNEIDEGEETISLMDQTDSGSLRESEQEDMGIEEEEVIDSAFPRPINRQDDDSDLLFDPNRLLRVEIDLPEDDWDELRFQTRELNLLEPDCLGMPFASPFTWFEATVTIDGTEFLNVGIRKKGFFGSLSEERPSLKVRLDKYVDDQTYQDVKRLTLNNSQQDPSLIKQCLAYDLFKQVGIASPRCHFAHVFINRRDYGVFVQVESVKKPFLKRFFEDADGLLYEGTLSDFRSDWLGTFRQKTNEDMPTDRPLRAITQVLEEHQNGTSDMSLTSALDQVMNLDHFFRFWAMETLIAHWDGYAGNTNNFLVYDDLNPGELVFIPWGVDGTFNTPYQLFEERVAPRSINTAGLLTRLLYEDEQGQSKYIETLNMFLEEVWIIENLEQAIDDKLSIVLEGIEPAQQVGVIEEVEKVKEFVREQKRLIRQELETGPVEWRTPPRETVALCGESAGVVSGEFETTWNTWPSDDLFMTGNGSMNLLYFDEAINIQGVGCGIGMDEDEPDKVVLLIPLYVGGTKLIFIRVLFDPEEIAPQSFEIYMDHHDCALFTYDFESYEFGEFTTCVGGALIFEEAGREEDAVIRGSLEIDLWGRRPFSL